MTKKTKRRRAFLETSGVIYHRHGHTLMRNVVEQATADATVQVSGFVRMEYLRGIVLNLIEFYFLIKESSSVSDAIIDWSQKVHQERKLKVVLMTIPGWLCGHEDRQAPAKSLRRLGELTVRLVREFDESFPHRIRDRLACRLGKLRFPAAAFREAVLLRFHERFRSIQRSVPDCDLCRFKDWQRRNLRRSGVDLHSPSQRGKYAQYKGYVTQAERLEEVVDNNDPYPKCRWCERLGDSIIALHVPKKATLVTADRAFVPFAELLNREVRLLPPLQELKRQLNEGAAPDR